MLTLIASAIVAVINKVWNPATSVKIDTYLHHVEIQELILTLLQLLFTSAIGLPHDFVWTVQCLQIMWQAACGPLAWTVAQACLSLYVCFGMKLLLFT